MSQPFGFLWCVGGILKNEIIVAVTRWQKGAKVRQQRILCVVSSQKPQQSHTATFGKLWCHYLRESVFDKAEVPFRYIKISLSWMSIYLLIVDLILSQTGFLLFNPNVVSKSTSANYLLTITHSQSTVEKAVSPPNQMPKASGVLRGSPSDIWVR